MACDLLVEVIKIGARGQFVIPASLRQSLNVKAGQKLLVFGDPRTGAVWVCPVEALEQPLPEESPSKLSSV